MEVFVRGFELVSRMGGSTGQLPSVLSALVGQRVTRVSRVLYRYRGAIESDDGPLELEAGGHIVLLEGAGDGECLRVKDGGWEDDFREPLSAENRAFLEECGKWERADCSMQEGYRDFVGHSLSDIRALKNDWGRIGGVRLSVAARSLWFVVDCDECHVYWAHPIGFTEAR